MSPQIKLSNAYNAIEELLPKFTQSEFDYCNILYTISTAVFENRLKKNMSQTEFAKLLGVSQAMVSKYESAEYNFTVKQICKLCERLDLSLNFSLSNSKTTTLYQDKISNELSSYESLGGVA